jgi:hypothetical protein
MAVMAIKAVAAKGAVRQVRRIGTLLGVARWALGPCLGRGMVIITWRSARHEEDDRRTKKFGECAEGYV